MEQQKKEFENKKNFQSKKDFSKYKEFDQKRVQRILELEKRNNIKVRNKRIEYPQIEGLENQMFVSQILNGVHTSVTIDGGHPKYSLAESDASDQFTAIVKTQGVNRVFNERDKFELWLLRRYQVAAQKQNLKIFGDQRRWLKKMLDAYYIVKKPYKVKKWLEKH